MSDESLDIECRDLSGLRFEVGTEAVAGFYYYPEGLLLTLDRTWVATRLRFQGLDCLEIHWQTWSPGNTRRSDVVDARRSGNIDATSYHVLSDEGIRCVRYVHRHDQFDMGECSEPATPRRLSIGMEGGGLKVFGDEKKVELQVGWKVTDVAQVAIGEKEFRALRKVSWESQTDKKPQRIVESYISDKGITLLQRCYVADDHCAFGNLSGQPEVIVEDIIYRLWCDMILDYVIGG